VCGRQDYWIRRHLPPAAPKLEHVNLTRLASALSHLDEEEQSITTDNWILLGGLSRLVDSLHRNYDFAPPQTAEIGKLAVLVVKGRLKPERFKALQAAGGKDKAAEQIPVAVNLTLGRAEQQPPHFPYRIEYLRQMTPREIKVTAKDTEGGTQPVHETPLCILELDEVEAPFNLDPRLFEFNPGDEESEDKTQTWLRKLQE